MSSNVSTADLRQQLENAGVVVGADPSSYAIANAVPLAVALPRTEEEVSAVLAVASRLGAAVAPWGGGTRLGLGNPPARYDLALDMRGLGRVVVHEPSDLTVTVQGGCTLAALQETLAQARQWLPLDPPLPDRATVGGVLATGVGGPLGAAFGLPREMVIGMRAALADGTIVKSGGNVVKNVTGFALDRLHVGGLGTLGVIVEATFKVLPLPRTEATVAARFTDAAAAVAATTAVEAIGFPTLAVELVSDAAWTVMHPGWTPPPPPDAEEGAEAVPGHWLISRSAGRPSGVARARDAWAAACESNDATEVEWLEDAESSALWGRITDLGWGDGTPLLAVRTAAPPSKGAELLAALGDSPSVVALSVTRGVARAAWGASELPDDPAAYLGELRDAVTALGGSLVVESVAPIEGVDPWGPPGEAYEVMRGLKDQYDPKGILNPGRFIGGI